MDELQKYVDTLFKHQRQSAKIKDLKEEILSNMIAKRSDLLAQGLDEETATQIAKESIASVEGLIDDNQLTKTWQYHIECLQLALINCTVFWILTLPLLFTMYAALSFLGLFMTAVLGTVYIIKSRKPADTLAFISMSVSKLRAKHVWIIWILFFLAYSGTMAALTFGSSIWFGYPVNISGPYQFYNIASRFYVPLITIVIPVTVSGFSKLLIKNGEEFSVE